MGLRRARWLRRAKSPTIDNCVSDLSPSPRSFEWSASGAGRPAVADLSSSGNQPTTGPTKALRLLVVEDSREDTFVLLRELRRGGYTPSWERVDTAAAMSKALNEQSWDLVVADFSMPQFNAFAALELLRTKGGDQPFIIVSGTIGDELAVKAMQTGAQDYILKGNLSRLVPAVERELREAIERRERKRAETELFKHQEQFRVAQEIQQRLFPKASPHFAPFDIAGASYPAEATGGDYFDYLPLADGSLGVVVADVTGHGVGPALLMAEARAYLRSLALDTTDVGEILTRLNRLLADDVDPERYVTLLLAKLNTNPLSLVYASAGHPACYVLEASGKVKGRLKHTGLPLGVPPRCAYPTAPVTLSPGDIVLLLTDGIEEAESPENDLFGTERVLSIVRAHAQRTAGEILEALFIAVKNFSPGNRQADDLTAVVLKVTPETPALLERLTVASQFHLISPQTDPYHAGLHIISERAITHAQDGICQHLR